jgi:hypothetical protein
MKPLPKPLQFTDHPVPKIAKRFKHLGAYFEYEGDNPVDSLWTGHDVADELTRGLLPWARENVLAEGRSMRDNPPAQFEQARLAA